MRSTGPTSSPPSVTPSSSGRRTPIPARSHSASRRVGLTTGAQPTAGHPFACAWSDGLREAEHAVRVVGGLDLREPGVVGAVVGLPPVGQAGVDVVLVGLAAGVGAHGLPEGLLPRV